MFVFVYLVVLFLFVLFYELSHSLLHTSCGVFSCLSGRVDLRLLALSFFTSLKLGLPVSQRSAAACEEKKAMNDAKMIDMLKNAEPCFALPLLALAEIVHVSEEEFARRLHLIIVDTWRQKWLSHKNVA